MKQNRKIWAIAAAVIIVILTAILLLHNKSAPADDTTADTNTPPIITVDQPTNFEGKVAETAVGSITLDNGRVVKITDDTTVTTLDGNDGIIFPGNYIQGYAEDPKGDEIVAEYIIITALGYRYAERGGLRPHLGLRGLCDRQHHHQ